MFAGNLRLNIKEKFKLKLKRFGLRFKRNLRKNFLKNARVDFNRNMIFL